MYYVAFSEVVAYLMLQQTCTSYSVPSDGTHPGGGAAHWSLYVMVKAKIIHQSARHIFCCLTTLAPLVQRPTRLKALACRRPAKWDVL